MFSLKKKLSPSNSAPAKGHRDASQSQANQQLQFPTESQSQSHSQSPQQTQQSQPLYPWSAHTSPSGQWPSPFPREFHALSTTATAAAELFLFGGFAGGAKSLNLKNDIYVISARDFSTTLLKTSGDVPSPRYGHPAVLTGTTLLIWGGTADRSNHTAQTQIDDDSVYLLNLVSREWTRIVVDGPGPGRRYYHSMTLVGSKLFVFGGRATKSRLNDIWALDLNCLKSNPLWESYEPAPGNKKPLPRAAHVAVTTGDRIIIFGGRGDPHAFNDTWSFNISTRKWTELQCTGSIPSVCASHAAVLIDDVMYVFGGRSAEATNLGDLTALNLSTQQWTAFPNIGPSPRARQGHSMACDGTRVFVLGGSLSPGAQVDETKLIHALDTKLLTSPKPDSNTVKHSEKTIQLAQKLSAGQPQQQTFSSSDSDVHAEHGTSPTPGGSDPASLQTTRDRTPGPNDLPSLHPGMNDKPGRVPEEVARLEHDRIADLERQLSEMLAAQTERDRYNAQVTDQLALKSALLEEAEANAVKARKRAGLKERELQAKLDELLLSRDQAEANAVETKKRAGLEQRELQEKPDELLLSRDQALEQAQSDLQKATFRAAEANERSQPASKHETELAEVYAKLDASESELATVRLRLTDAEAGWAKSKAEADTLRTSTQAGAGLVNMDVDRVMRRLVRSVEAEMDSLRGNEKSIESMECRNEG